MSDLFKYINKSIQSNESSIQDYEVYLSVYEAAQSRLNDLIFSSEALNIDSVIQKRIFTTSDLNDFIAIAQLNRKSVY